MDEKRVDGEIGADGRTIVGPFTATVDRAHGSGRRFEVEVDLEAAGITRLLRVEDLVATSDTEGGGPALAADRDVELEGSDDSTFTVIGAYRKVPAPPKHRGFTFVAVGESSGTG